MFSIPRSRFVRCLIVFGAGSLLFPPGLVGGEPIDSPRDWIPPAARDWTSLGDRLEASFRRARKESKTVLGGELWAPLVSVDRTDGTLFAFPQSGALWVSRDRGQTFEWLDREVPNWGFNESPTSLCVSPEGKKMRIFSSERSGYSLDGGKTWKYMNFKLKFGFEDGHLNWHGDGKMIVARSHTWPSRMWLSRDGGDSFTEFSPEIAQRINTQNMALLDDDVLLFQGPQLVRTDDYGKTLSEASPPKYRGPDGKFISGTFLGVSHRFKDKVYWLNSTGVCRSADKGNTWTIVGQPFPHEWIRKRLVRSGPLFGKDENQILVLCSTHVAESLDGGKSWHVLAELPVELNDHPWAYSFAYDPVGDVLYCNNREHSGGPYLFGRLALKRWGDTDAQPPSDPTDLRTELLPAGNGVSVRWKPSSAACGIYSYMVYVDGALTCRTDRPEIVLSNYAWNQELKVAVQAVDAWRNSSAKAERIVRLGDRPANIVPLKDMKSATATFDAAPIEFLANAYTAFDKRTLPVTYLVDGYEPNPVPKHVRRSATNGFGIRIKPSFKKGVLEYALDRKYSRLLLDAGMSRSDWDRVQLKILLDGKEVVAPRPFDYETRIRHIGRKAEAIDIDVSNAVSLRFEIDVVDNRYWQEDVLVFGNGLLFARK
jgi:hypothetical protein